MLLGVVGLATAYDASDDTPLVRLADRQHGVVAIWQILALGLSHTIVARRVRAGRLHRRHPGVYAVGRAGLTQRGEWMAATLACGPYAVLSHDHAAALYRLRRAGPGPIHVTAPVARRIDGIVCHRARDLRGRPRCVVDGIPVTSIERTALDMAVRLSAVRLRSLLEEMQRRDRFDLRLLDGAIARSSGHHGIGRLRAVLAELADLPPQLRSGLELLFLEIVRAAGLPEPIVNVVVAGEAIDVHWPEHGIVVEVDSWR